MVKQILEERHSRLQAFDMEFNDAIHFAVTKGPVEDCVIEIEHVPAHNSMYRKLVGATKTRIEAGKLVKDPKWSKPQRIKMDTGATLEIALKMLAMFNSDGSAPSAASKGAWANANGMHSEPPPPPPPPQGGRSRQSNDWHQGSAEESDYHSEDESERHWTDFFICGK
eukprot:gnl/TRDRNA2_/TRDRNA2_174387_c7_seq1.p2 gnl/TRDRNA2_/TRDRNA2_174387_c7~~gnl/TRDRNA2_/TRDRNA2_174387_c7_seq1.p2  ORF type:complete len:168 (-),score=27.75 gnl/TRDRNA2_/TRDRNA2_174387_c7_seq1:113-616(-)